MSDFVTWAMKRVKTNVSVKGFAGAERFKYQVTTRDPHSSFAFDPDRSLKRLRAPTQMQRFDLCVPA